MPVDSHRDELKNIPLYCKRLTYFSVQLYLVVVLCCIHDRNIKIVFASRYGELDRLKKLVYQYTQENEVSPATFSGSVHNSAVGQFSLLNRITKSYNSISAEEFICSGSGDRHWR